MEQRDGHRGLAPRTTRETCPTAPPYAGHVRPFAIRPAKNSRNRATASGSASNDQRRQDDVGSPVDDDRRLHSRRRQALSHSDTSPPTTRCHRRAPRTARSHSRTPGAANRTSIRSRKKPTPPWAGSPAFPASASASAFTRIPVNRAFRRSATSCARLFLLAAEGGPSPVLAGAERSLVAGELGSGNMKRTPHHLAR